MVAPPASLVNVVLQPLHHGRCRASNLSRRMADTRRDDSFVFMSEDIRSNATTSYPERPLWPTACQTTRKKNGKKRPLRRH